MNKSLTKPLLIVCFCLLSLAGYLYFQQPKDILSSNNFELMQWGTFGPLEDKTKIIDSESAVGYHWSVDHVIQYEYTDNIPLKRDTVFGITYLMLTCTDDTTPNLKQKIIHPPIVNQQGKTITENISPSKMPCVAGEVYDALLYVFEDKREMVPGRWTFQLLHEDKVVLSKTLIVK